jgi:unsaturated rhamnogalacturonyl hydrolase
MERFMTPATLRGTFLTLAFTLLFTGCSTMTSSTPDASGATAVATEGPWSVRTAKSVVARSSRGVNIERDPASTAPPKWSYSTAFNVYAVAMVGEKTGDQRLLDYGRDYVRAFTDDSGKIVSESFKPETYKLDDVAPGRLLLLLARTDSLKGGERYLNGARQLVEQLKTQPRTADGGFWHKQIYEHQMWLDGIFMGCPFMAEYAKVASEPRWADEAANQILTIAKHTRDPKTSLYFHGWDESRKQKWADKQTGLSPHVWGRAVGWYVMGIVETLENIPKDHPRRAELLALLNQLSDAIVKAQDPGSGVWWQVMDQPGRKGNYLESSASSMFVFALAKGVRLGYLDADKFAPAIQKGYAGIHKQFIEVDPADGQVSLKDTCQVAGLGGKPYRDGSFDYYVGEKRVSNDPKGVAPFILAAMEMEQRK